MNTITIVVTVLTIWLVMGLSFLSAYFKDRREGKSLTDTLTSYEGLLFIASVVIPIIILIHSATIN